MSRTYSIACHDCRIHLWIGQASSGKGHLYSTPENMRAMYDFMVHHEGHRLEYGNNCLPPIDEYEEIEP